MRTIIAVLCTVSTISFVSPYIDVPIIGILSQEAFSVAQLFPNETYHSYITASYVKLLESAGARIVPILIGQNVSYYKNIIENTNGVLFPGGRALFNRSNGFADAGKILYDLALDLNKNGDYYPVIGICLGMELLAQVAVGGQELRADCLSKKESYPLEFKDGYRKSKIFANTPKEIIRILKTENVTYNYHRFCVTEQNFTQFGLDKDWAVISTNNDHNGFEFISVFESKTYPFYGLQFHPEKNPFEFKKSLKIPHSRQSIEVSQYFANFFVEESRKNNHSFENQQSELKSLIYNYKTEYTGIKNSSYEQLYVFKKTNL